jgi:hypothetical protein
MHCQPLVLKLSNLCAQVEAVQALCYLFFRMLIDGFQKASNKETAAVPPAAATELRQELCTSQLASQEPSGASSANLWTVPCQEAVAKPVPQQLKNEYLKYDKYRDACIAALRWLSNSLRGSMAIDELLQLPGSAPLKEVLGPALKEQLADVATGQAMLQLLTQLQTEADNMELASDGETAASCHIKAQCPGSLSMVPLQSSPPRTSEIFHLPSSSSRSESSHSYAGYPLVLWLAN